MSDLVSRSDRTLEGEALVKAVSPNIEGVGERIFEAPDGSSFAMPVAELVEEKTKARVLLTRWRFTPDEREAIGAGIDLYLIHGAGLNKMQPVVPCIGEPKGIKLP